MTPWERRLLTGRRYFISDLRIVSGDEELALDDVGDVHRQQTGLQRVLGLSTVEVRSRDPRRRGLVLRGVRQGAQLAALIELLAADPVARRDGDAVRETMAWEPRVATPGTREGLTAILLVVASVVAVVVGLHGKTPSVSYPDNDEIYPHGQKRDHAAIVRFMQTEVMPWARQALAPIVGSADKVTCATCHGASAEASGWRMPGVAALPRPIVREAGWENFGGPMDAQMRNAIYGYSADGDKTSKAGYMREVVMPGMARLLHRPPYDFTRTYEYNREHFAFGC
ncbi:MAG TPA: hypothetical protein VG710_08480, partial [Opitutus sp.]|nr:hypothetical protein [Opitutus sp.]